MSGSISFARLVDWHRRGARNAAWQVRPARRRVPLRSAPQYRSVSGASPPLPAPCNSCCAPDAADRRRLLNHLIRAQQQRRCLEDLYPHTVSSYEQAMIAQCDTFVTVPWNTLFGLVWIIQTSSARGSSDCGSITPNASAVRRRLAFEPSAAGAGTSPFRAMIMSCAHEDRRDRVSKRHRELQLEALALGSILDRTLMLPLERDAAPRELIADLRTYGERPPAMAI